MDYYPTRTRLLLAWVGLLGLTLATAFAGSAAAQVNDKPWEENWWPSKWGADDSAGSSNHTKNPANVKRALSVVKQFKVVTIGRAYHREMPNFGVRSWNLTIPGTPTGVRSARTD